MHVGQSIIFLVEMAIYYLICIKIRPGLVPVTVIALYVMQFVGWIPVVILKERSALVGSYYYMSSR